ncbi:LacI family transcriptional regulator [Hanamia caeni]|jgi:DNA-binding LacI/PurR family transcriptional regulator|uniref:LacI family transcriptional regulator n=1 Tax=Hanamia caeni TaxID=2294116 RepID=A0A3M9NM06_9BACT|nr:LacI family DNA-binding transcriptional regulator [Hanamia caeni]RNI38028.1 LacI family transcriptional regulator [Hanamia caeni]
MEHKIATLKEIAKKLNFSVSTVSRALRNHPSIGLRTTAEVQKLAKELNYEPNQTALLFKQQKTHTIGLILPNLKEDFFSQAINGIEDIAKQKKYSVLIGQSHDDVEQEIQIVNAMKNHRVDGLIVSISKYTENYDHLLKLGRYNIPIVFFDRVPNLSNVDKVSSDIASGTRQAIEFLIKNKHRRIGLINGPKEMKSCKDRTDAYLEVLKRKRIKIDVSLLESTDLTQAKTFLAMENLLNLKKPPTAIVTINDYVALDAIQFARKAKLKINKDICFVSYANLPITSYLENPPLASVEQFPYEQAKKAAEILFNIFEKQKDSTVSERAFSNIVIEGQLIVNKKAT